MSQRNTYLCSGQQFKGLSQKGICTKNVEKDEIGPYFKEWLMWTHKGQRLFTNKPRTFHPEKSR